MLYNSNITLFQKNILCVADFAVFEKNILRLAGQSIFQKCDFLKKQCSKIFSTKDIDLIFFVTCFLDFEADLTI